MSNEQGAGRIRIAAVYRDAWRIYRLLARRSVLTAALVFAVLRGVEVLRLVYGGGTALLLLGALSQVLWLAGPVVVQGALVEIVRNIHEGKHPERIPSLYRRAGSRFWSLLWASIVYGFGVFFGLLLLIVPGLIAAARWAAMAPIIVLEGGKAGYARERSSVLVRGQTGAVMLIVVVTFLLFAAPSEIGYFTFPGHAIVHQLMLFAWNVLTAPFEAHVLTVLYYRLTDPERPVIDEAVFRWESVWEAG